MFADPRLLSRYNASKANDMLWRSLLDDAYLFSQPHRYTFNTKTVADRNEAQVYDPTLLAGTISFASKMQTLLTPPGVQWLTIVMSSKAKKGVSSEQIAETEKALEFVTRVAFDFIHRSNFELSANESYFDLAVGTAAITVDEGDDDNPLIFNVVPTETFYPEEGPFNTIETIWRDYLEIPIRNIQYQWPKAKLTDTLRQVLDGDETATTHLIEGTVYNEKTRMYKYMVLAADSHEILFQEESPSSRWVVFRWSRRATEIRGRGPVINALGAALSLNQLFRFELQNAALRTARPLMAYNDGIFNPYNISLEPGSIISINQPAGGTVPIMPIDLGGDLNFSQVSAVELREQINRLMFANPLGPINAPAKTATEIAIRNQALIEEIGPAFGRLQVEFLPKIMDRVLYILSKKGLIDLKVESIKEKDIDYVYESPVNRGQEEIDLNNFVRYFDLLQSTMGPEAALGAINAEELGFWLGDKLGVDARLLKTPEAVKETIEQVSAALQQQNVPQGTQPPDEGPDLV